MADFESFKELTAALAQEGSLPHWRQQALAVTPEARVFQGERHGSWFVEVRWYSHDLERVASVSVTAADARSQRVSLVARAGATTEDRYIIEPVERLSRAISRVADADLNELMSAALDRAQQYRSRALVDAYETPAPSSPTTEAE